MKTKVFVFDTTLRDGEQAPGVAMRPEQKLEIAEELQTLGVDVIEAGFPAASMEDAKTVAAIAKRCRGTCICAFARAKAGDIESAAEAVKHASAPRISLVMPVSDLHLQRILRTDRESALEILKRSVVHARNACAEVEFIAADISRADPTFLCQAVQAAIESGASFVTLADTVGYATPHDIAGYFDALHNTVPSLDKITLGIHCHDDLGLATINTLQAIESGARQLHCTVGGIGERAGNAALEEVVMAVATRADRYPFSVGVDTARLWPISHRIADIAGFIIPPNKAIIGSNAFSHGSGMHQDGILKAVSTYEIIDPSCVGAPGRQLPITRHSGRKGLAVRIENLGFVLSDEQLNAAFAEVKSQTCGERVLSDDELRYIVNSTCVRT